MVSKCIEPCDITYMLSINHVIRLSRTRWYGKRRYERHPSKQAHLSGADQCRPVGKHDLPLLCTTVSKRKHHTCIHVPRDKNLESANSLRKPVCASFSLDTYRCSVAMSSLMWYPYRPSTGGIWQQCTALINHTCKHSITSCDY